MTLQLSCTRAKPVLIMFLRRIPKRFPKLRNFSTEIDKLKLEGFTEEESRQILLRIDEELDKLTADLATQEQLKKLETHLNEQISSASSFVISTSPFKMNFPANMPLNSNLIGANSFPTVLDPLLLEKEIKSTGQQLTDEIKQLQADYQLDANLDAKRREEVDAALEDRLEDASEYASKRVKDLNEHLDRVSRQALTAIGGKRPIILSLYLKITFLGFVGILAAVFVSYSLLSTN